MKRKKTLGVSDLVSTGIYVVKRAVKEVIFSVRDDPDSALEKVLIGERKKPALRVDVIAEEFFKRELHKYKNRRFKHIKVYGEENLRDAKLDLSAQKETLALVDAIDGSDLLERGFWNWCTAAIFFNPSKPEKKRITAAIVGLPSGEVYYATSDNEEVFVRRVGEKVPTPVGGCTKVKSLKRASICFYGQKADNFLCVAQNRFGNKLRLLSAHAKKNRQKLGIRIYNLAGIPMMMKLVDHRVATARGVDVIFDLKGQKPHDFVCGAFIAKKAGAVVKHLDGREVSFEEMESLLSRPGNGGIRYVIASTEALSKSLIDFIRGRSKAR